jgi:GMP synthase (glutamine-hydrolysing)
MTPKILLLQARDPGDPAKPEERASFADKANLPVSAFVSHDLLNGPPTIEQIQDYDALMVGGSGDYSVTHRNLPYLDETLAFLESVVETGHPTFASCFGFHLITEALGGELDHAPQEMEVGTFEITLTPEGGQDELFNPLPTVFNAQLGRKDRAIRLPPSLTRLAFSDRCPVQAFRVQGKPIWATQFHPELSGEENHHRYLRYVRMYSDYLDQDGLDAILDKFNPSPATLNLIPRFLELINNKK